MQCGMYGNVRTNLAYTGLAGKLLFVELEAKMLVAGVAKSSCGARKSWTEVCKNVEISSI